MKRQHLDTGWAWIILLASVMINTLRGGIFTSLGLYLVPWQEQLSGSVTKLQWAMSLVAGIPFIIGPVTNALCKFHGIRQVVMVGAIFSCAAFFAAWFATSVKHLYICFAFAGLGFGLYYQPSLVILAYFFKKRLARANGISSVGNGIGNFAFPPLLQLLIDQYGWNGAVLITSGIAANVAVFGALYRPSDLELRNRRRLRSRYGNIENAHECEASCKADPVKLQLNTRTSDVQNKECTSTERDETQNARVISPDCCHSGFIADILTSFNFHLLLDARFIPLFLANCPYGFGYAIVLAYLPAMAVHNGIQTIKAAFLLSLLGIFSVAARFTHGFLIDSNILSASMLTAISFLLSAIATALFPVTNNYNVFAFLSVLVGIGSGIFNSTVPVVAKDYVGVNRVSGAVGLMMLSTGAGLFLGLFLTGILYDMTGSYTIAFLLAGAAFLISSILLFVDPLVRHVLKYN